MSSTLIVNQRRNLSLQHEKLLIDHPRVGIMADPIEQDVFLDGCLNAVEVDLGHGRHRDGNALATTGSGAAARGQFRWRRWSVAVAWVDRWLPHCASSLREVLHFKVEFAVSDLTLTMEQH